MSTFFADDSTETWFADPFGGSPGTPPPPTGFDSGSSALRVAVAVVERDPEDRAYLVSLLGGGVSPFATLDELAVRLDGSPVIAVLGPSCTADGSLASADRLLQHHAEVGAILVANELSTALLQQALRAGVKDVLTKCLGSRNHFNVVYATLAGLKELKSPETISQMRGKTVELDRNFVETAEVSYVPA